MCIYTAPTPKMGIYTYSLRLLINVVKTLQYKYLKTGQVWAADGHVWAADVVKIVQCIPENICASQKTFLVPIKAPYH